MITYLLQVSLVSALFYLLYHLSLSKLTYFKINRVYLISALLLSFALPFLPDFETTSTIIETAVPNSNLSALMENVDQFEREAIVITADRINSSFPFDWLSLLYWFGFAITAAHLLYGMYKLYLLYKGGELEKKGGLNFVLTEGAPHLPFSFFNLIFWSKAMPLQGVSSKQMIEHEAAHVKSWHSIDLMLMEVITLVAWYFPMVYLYRAAIRNNHEYEADAYVVRHSSKKAYGHLLIQQSLSGPQIAFVNHFIHSQLKNRILMLTRKKSSHWSLGTYLLSLPLALLLLLAFNTNQAVAENPVVETVITDTVPQPLFMLNDKKLSYELVRHISPNLIESIHVMKGDEIFRTYGFNHKDGVVNIVCPSCKLEDIKKKAVENPEVKRVDYTVKANKRAILDGEPVFRIVEQMPLFPGCENKDLAREEIRDCANDELLQYIYNNIKYPKIARDNGIEGTVVVSFVIDKEGNIVQPEMRRSLGGYFDDVVLHVVNKMPQWSPGKQRGQEVAVQFNLPIKFKLTDDMVKEDAQDFGKLELKAFSVAPNPTNGMVQLLFEAEAGPTIITVSDASGKEVMRKQLINFDGIYNSQIDLTDAPKGMLFVSVRQKDKVYTSKIVKQ
ncbi:MAG: TonB family protein [Bacteroidota bacterium]